MYAEIAKDGASSLEDHKLLETILFGARPRVDTYPLSHRLLKRFGTLDGVFSASREELLEIEGLGERCADYLAACGELITRSVFEYLASRSDTTDRELSEAVRWLLRNKGTDSFVVLVYGSNGALAGYLTVSPGADLSRIADFADEMKEMGAKEAHFAHVHPEGGEATPADIDAAERLDAVFSDRGIGATRHLIVTGNTVKEF